jgi:ABC-type Mn2+/Zn2+ transport system permease subunit
MMDWITEPFSYAFMQRALLVSVLLGIAGGMLGCILVLRRLALMGDALAHSLLPGVALAYLMFGASAGALLAGGLIAGLITAVGSGLISRLTRMKEEAAFGSLYLMLFAAGIAIASTMPVRINLLHFLFGNVLGAGPTDVVLAAGACVLTIGVFVAFHRGIVLETFDPVFHRATGGRGGLVHIGILVLTVLNLVAALQSMGIVLALGLFLLPAVTAYLWCDRLRHMLVVSAAIAVVGSTAGILVSYHAGWPSGSAIVICLGAGFIGSAIASPRYGALAKIIRQFREARAVVHSEE